MINIHIIAVGILKTGAEFNLIEEYKKRLGFMRLSITQIDARKYASKKSQALQIHATIKNPTFLISLDESGKDLSTLEFCHTLKNNHSVTCVIGGADGIEKSLIQSSHLILRLGRMTWPHMMARVLLVEQIYRCQQIILQHPYHRA